MTSRNVGWSTCYESAVHKPDMLGLVKFKCPETLCRNNVSDEQERHWICKICWEQLKFGFDNHFYCSCGKASCNTFEFKCCNENHIEFETFDDATLTRCLSQIEKYQELNILILGATGVGKSTWINGFANYLSFQTMTEAMEHDIVSLIPTQFTITDDNMLEKVIRIGDDKNENIQATGQSATQFPKTYNIRCGERIVRLIDTPGIGDTRGIERDKENFQNIMNHLGSFDEIHGICILLKPNNVRITVMFSFCIKELLTHLHIDACRNIVFCFTNSRSTLYRPGDTMPALKKLLGNDKQIKIELSKETVYCIDNEAVRFLAAIRHPGITFSPSHQKEFAKSWKKSVEENNRLVEYISKLPPHTIRNTLSLNESRRIILALTKPLAEISKTIQDNIQALKDREQNIKTSKEDKTKLAKNLYIPVIDLKTTPLDYPRTVCASQKCIEHITVGGVDKINYKTHCHSPCGISGTQANTINLVALKGCWAINSDLNCKMCGCVWSIHMHITYDCKQVTTKIVDESVRKQIKSSEDAIAALEQHVKDLQSRVTDYEEEQRKITEVGARFAQFLKSNAIAPYNDALGEYLSHLIEIERGKVDVGDKQNTLHSLEKMLLMYHQEVKVLDSAMGQGADCKPLEIKQLIKSISEMKLMGKQLSEAMEVAESCDHKNYEYREKVFRPVPLQQKEEESIHFFDRMINSVASLTQIFFNDEI